MKRLVWLALLVSLGLNIGLGFRLADSRRDDRAEAGRRFADGRGAGRAGQGGSRPALTDSAAWADFAQHRFERLADRLELRDDQRSRFAAVHHDGAHRVHGQGLRVRAARLRLHELYRADDLDEEAVRSAVVDLATAQAGMDSLVAEALISELEVLDQDQRARYLDLIPWEQRHSQAHGAGRGRENRSRR